MPLPPLPAQADRLDRLGLLPDDGTRAGADAVRSAAARLGRTAPPGALLVVHPRHLAPSALAPRMRRTVRTSGGTVEREGFVVVDMTDVDAFGPVDVTVPDVDVYAVAAPDRGDDLANASPAEAQPVLAGRGRSPLTLAEGVHWVLQDPAVLEPNHCFMTIGSRLRRPDGTLDARTPAIWVSGGTGRDGAERRGAPKVGWCWWRNRHTWLGFAATDGRLGS